MCFVFYTIVTVSSGIIGIDNYLDGDFPYLAPFLSKFVDVLCFSFAVIVNSLAIAYFLFFLNKRMKYRAKIIVLFSLIFVLLFINIMYMYTAAMITDPPPNGVMYNVFSLVGSCFVIAGCLLSGFAVLFIYRVFKLILEKKDV